MSIIEWLVICMRVAFVSFFFSVFAWIIELRYKQIKLKTFPIQSNICIRTKPLDCASKQKSIELNK